SPAWPGVPYARGMSNRPESGDEPRGSADDVALATDGDRLWICASWSSLDGEEVWLGEVTGGSLGALVRAGDGDRPWFRPAVAALPGGALGLALSPGGWMAGTVVRDRRPPLRWEAEVDGAPWHAAVAVCRERGEVWLALEVRRGREREIRIGVLDPERGGLREIGRLGGAGAWCRWPALAAAPGGGALLAWCEGPAGGGGRIAVGGLAREGGTGAALGVPGEAGGDAPARAMGADGWAALAWHTGGPVMAASGERDASVRRALRAARWDVAGGRVEA